MVEIKKNWTKYLVNLALSLFAQSTINYITTPPPSPFDFCICISIGALMSSNCDYDISCLAIIIIFETQNKNISPHHSKTIIENKDIKISFIKLYNHTCRNMFHIKCHYTDILLHAVVACISVAKQLSKLTLKE